MILFTTVAGAAQGLLLLLVGFDVARRTGAVDPGRDFFVAGAVLVVALACAGLGAATFHLGRPMRAWRAVAMWRTSWLSREVIVLPAFIGIVALWGLGHWQGRPQAELGVAAAGLALLLFLCTGMIYAAVKAIRAWATPMTPLNFALIGCASGALLGTALAAALAPVLVTVLALPAAALTLAAAAARGATLWRNLHGPEKTTLQTALGVRHPRIRQISQGAMGGSFGTREFFHGRSSATLRGVRWGAALAGFALPAAVLAAAPASALALGALWLVQVGGLLAERWSFFAEGQHTQNLYHRAVG
jgi:DMSO reductase anchor subunit